MLGIIGLFAGRSAGQTYSLTDLGETIGTNSYAQGINNQSQVVGYWDATNGAHAFIYQAGSVLDLGLLGLGATNNNYALSINNMGQVVGFSETTNGARAFLYQNGAVTNLGSLGGAGSYAFGINQNGQIVGYVETPEGARAILYDGGNTINIGTLGGSNSFAFGINNSLQVAGTSLLADNAVTHAFLWQDKVISDLNEIQVDANGWELSDAHGINDYGNIVGWGLVNNQEHAFLFSNGGVVIDLGVLTGGTNSYALGLNNSNQVVGASSTASGNHAVVWLDGNISDLNDSLNVSGWELREACGINDLGQIVGWGTINGQRRAFLLTPNNSTASKKSASLATAAVVSSAVSTTVGKSTNLVVTVRYAPSLNGGTIEGSLQQLNGEGVTANGGFAMTGDLLVPGTPTLVLNGKPTYAGTLVGSGSAAPSGYRVTLNGNCSLRYLRTRTTPISLPTVAVPPTPKGTRCVNINSAGQSYGDATTLRDLTLNGNVGMIAVPPGTYGTFTVNGGSGLVLGVTNGVQAVSYNLQNLNLNGGSTLKIVGPVVLTLAHDFTANGMVGASNNPAWLQLQVACGGFTLNGGCTVYGQVLAPNGTVIVNGNSTLVGTSASDRFILNGCGLVRWGGTAASTNQPPVIVTQPVSQTVCAGTTAGFCVSATGSALNYQWRFNGANICGAKGSCYTVTNATPCQAGNYSVVVCNSCGMVTSSNAVLTVSVPPAITSQPISQTVCAGTSAGFCVSAAGCALNYQWRFNGTNLSGATGNCYTVTNATPSKGGNYSVVVSNSCGKVTSSNAVLTVSMPPVITSQLISQTVCAGTSAGFFVSATGCALNYQWRFNSTNICGAKGSCYTVTNAVPSQAGNYSVVVSNSCGMVTSGNAVLTVSVPPMITSQPISQTVCVGTSAGFCVRATGCALNYQWRFNGTNICGAKGSCYTVTNATPGQAGNYSAVVSNSCGMVSSANAVLTVSVPPVISSQPISQTVCVGTTAGFCVSATGSALNYQWQFNSTNLSGATGNCYTVTNATPSQAGNYSVVVSNSCGMVSSTKAVLTVLVGPVITQQPTNVTVIQGSNATFSVTATGTAPLGYQWHFNGTNALVGGTNSVLTLTNVQSSQAGTYSVMVTNVAGSVTSTNAVLTVLVGPVITQQPTSVMAIQGSNTTFTVTAMGTAPLSYQWYFNGTKASAGSTNLVLTLTNVQVSQAGTYSVVVTNVVGNVTSTNAWLSVLVGPVISIQQPTNSSSYVFGSIITNVAGAYDLGGSVTNVQFYDAVNGITNLLTGSTGQSGTNFTLILTNVPVGSNSLVAVATDNNGLSTTSAPVNITVASSGASVVITSPINQVFLAHSNITVFATVTENLPGVTVSWVDFYWGTNTAGTNLFWVESTTNGGYQAKWQPEFAGTYVLTATAVDSRGTNIFSSPVTNIVRSLPAVSLFQPTNGTFYLSSPTNLVIRAFATADPSTSITNVTFYQGTNLIGFTTAGMANIYQITWNGVTTGVYTLTAKAFDSNGASSFANNISITVATNHPPFVYAGPPQTNLLSTNAMQLTGMAADDGLPFGTLVVNWKQISGPTNVSFTLTNQPMTSVFFSATGVYQFQLSVNDGQYTVYSTNTVTILPWNLAPVVNAGTNRIIVLAARYVVTNNIADQSFTASGKSSQGREFWLGMLQNYENQADYPLTLEFFISSETNTSGSISIPGLDYFTNFTVIAGTTTTILLPISAEVETSDQVEAKGIHVKAESDISVYGLTWRETTADGYLGIPVNAIGTNYIVLGWMNTASPSEFLIVGTAKGTKVTIIPSTADLSGVHKAGVPYTTNLDEGQTYQLQDSGGDLSGTVIVADKPISVFGGNKCAKILEPACDVVVEQLAPTNSWGREFLTVPFASRTGGDVFQIVAAGDNTTITIVTNGVATVTTLDGGQVDEFMLADPSIIKSDKPIELAQYSTGQWYGGYPGDPAMMLIPPYEQFLTDYAFTTATNDFFLQFVNLVVTNTGVGLIFSNGTAIDPTNFFALGDSGYSYAQLAITAGTYHLTGTHPFGVFVYGLGEFDAYAYSGGFTLGDIANVAGVALNPQCATNEVGTTCSVMAAVTDPNQQPVSGVRVDFQVTGSNSLAASLYTDANGLARFYYTGTALGTDMITASVGTNSAVATNFWNVPSFVLQGSVWDDGLPVGKTNISWTQAGGPPVLGIFTPQMTNPTVQVSESGFYTFQLTANDTVLTNSALVGITVVRNQPPSVDAGANQIIKSDSTHLAGSVTDDGLPNGTLTVTWSQVSGLGTVTFQNPNQAATTATFSAPGVYVLRLTGDDSQATSSSDVTISVLMNPQPVECGQVVNASLASTNLHSIELTNSYANYYEFVATSNQVLDVTMISTNFDDYLIIRNQQLQILAEDDDSYDVNLGTTNARITYSLPGAGVYIIEATSSAGSQVGNYTLSFACPPPPPWSCQVTLFYPSDGTAYSDPADIPVYASVVASGNIDHVALYTNGVLLANLSAESSYYYYDWSGVPAGNYTLTAVAYGYDSFNVLQSTNSAPVSVSVGAAPSSVSIVSPTNNSVFVNAPADISITTVAFLPNGVQQMDFYTNSVLCFSISQNGSTSMLDWSGVPNGNYSLTAVASGYDADNNWISITSAPVNVEVAVLLPQIVLNPVNTCAKPMPATGTATITASLEDSNGHPTAGNVTFDVSGANATNATVATTGAGVAYFSYTGANAGRDQIAAMATVGGLPVFAVAERDWAEPISCGQIWSGTLTNSSATSSRSGYADYYAFYGQSNDTVVITMNSQGFDTFLNLWDGSCNLVSSNDDFYGSDAQITYTLPGSGNYVIEAASSLPAQTGIYTLQFACNPVTSTGTPQMAVLQGGQVLSNYATVDFGATTVSNPIAIAITLTNLGTAPLALGAVSVAGDFSVSHWPTAQIAAGGSASFTVQFKASTNEFQIGQLEFADGDPVASPFILNLSAVANIPGTPPAVTLTNPATNSVFGFGTNIVVSATASASSGYSISNVQFVAAIGSNQILIGVVTNLPYTINWVFPNPGVYFLFAVATDNAGRASYSAPPVSVQILAPSTNHAPVAVNDQFVVFENSYNNVLNVLSNDLDADGNALQVLAVTKPGNGGTVSILNGGKAVSYTPAHGFRSMDGSSGFGLGDQFTYEISDGHGGTAWATVNIGIFATAKPQVILISPPDGFSTNAGSVVPFVAYVTPSQYVTNVQFFVGEVLIGSATNGAGGLYTNYWVASAKDCTCAFTATAYDSFGQMGTSQGISVTVIPPANGPGGSSIGPVAAFATFAASTNAATPFTNLVTVHDGIFNLSGQVYHPLGSNDMVWQLGVYSQDGQTLLRDLTPKPLANAYHAGTVGSTSTSGILASNCDLTALQNGVYTMRLVAMGGCMITNTDVQFILESGLKIGQFSFSQQDLVIPVNGIPLTVTRTYNSINPDKGDFGYSWTYALNDMDVAQDETREEDSGWNADTESNQQFSQRVNGGRDVTLTLPNGQRTTFYYSPASPDGYNQYPAWTAAPGVTAILTAQYNPEYEVFYQQWIDRSPDDSDDYNVPYGNYDIPGFILTTHDGTQYIINRLDLGAFEMDGGYTLHAWGQPYLAQIVQRNGDTISIDQGGVTFTTVNGATRQILFQRNRDGLITSISDPMGQTTGGPDAVKYEYDGYGNLMYVERLVDRAAGNYVTNTFLYANANFPHYITDIINADGTQVARNFYDNSGRLTAVQDANGNLTQFIHNLTNDMEVVIDQLGFGSTNYYDLRGNVTTTINALGQTNRFAFDGNNYLLSSVDPLGHTNSYGYDANGCRIATTNALGQATHLNFDGYGQLLSKTDALMNATSFAYDSGGRRTQVMDALGHSTTFGHDVYGRPAAVTNALNQLRATAGSDTSGNLQFVSQVGGLRMDFGHDLDGNTTNTSFVWVNPVNSQTQTLSTITELDAANRVTRVTDPDGQSRTTVYDLAGRVAQNVDRMGNTNSYIYDPMGNLIQTTYADGSVARNVYDARNQMLYSDDRHLPGVAVNGSHKVYDPLGRVIRSERLANVQIDITSSGATGQSVITSAGAVLSASSTAYDAAGRVLATTNALNYVTRYEYDAVGRQTAVIDALSNRTDSVYDAGGQLRFTTNALKQLTEYQYDAKGRRIKTIFPDNSFTTNSYNEIGQLMFVRDQAGLETDYQYDNLGRMTNISKPLVFNPEGVTNDNPQYGYQYDSYGNILDIRDPKGRETKFAYDAFGQLMSRTLPLLQTNFNAYNALGQLAMAVDYIGQSNRFVYDSLGRVATNFLYPAGATVPSQTNIFIYDANGRLYQTLRPEGITTFQYNLDGAVTNITSPEGVISYEYDPTMGYLTRAYTVNSDIHYAYDELCRLKTVSVLKRDGLTLAVPEVTTNTYTKAGSLQDMYYPNGVHAAYQYDVMNRLTNLTYTSSASVLLSQYSYIPNVDGWRLAATEILRQVNGAYATNRLAWGYDNLGRLTNETSSSTLASLNFTNKYVYDLAGNRLWKTNIAGAVTTTTGYSCNANDQLVTETNAAGSFTNKYDANGSVTNRSSANETNLYAYNLEGRLATATIRRTEGGTPVVQTNKYFYSQSGIRTRAEMTGSVNQTNIFLNDPQNLTGFSQVLEELPAIGATPTASYTIGSQLISQKKSGTNLYFMADGHGSTRFLTDTNGTISDRYSYDAYGVALDFTFGTLNPPRTAMLYSSERFDSDLQQYYLRARYYYPTVGRFGTQDQVDGTPNDPLSLHKYAYCQNNPVNGRDPSGNDLIGLTLTMSIGVGLDMAYNGAVAYLGSKLQTEASVAGESLQQIEGQDASPDVDTATIIVHGVAGHKVGWSLEDFQPRLRAPQSSLVPSAPLNQDFYEFDWGGFSVGNAPPFLVPVKSVHSMAFIHLQAAQMLVWMKGYDKINVISHSWGTTLSYDLMNSGGIEMHDWVTMGSPLNHNISKPVWNTGKWINFYSYYDPIVYLDMYPDPGWHSPLGAVFFLPSFTLGVFNPPQVDDSLGKNMGAWGALSILEHSRYWNDDDVIDRIRQDLQ